VNAPRAIAATDPALARLLAAANLPVSDLAEGDATFLVFGRADSPVAVGGLARFGSLALLRSIAVDAAARRNGHGSRIVDALLASARDSGIAEVWLLTEKAERFFAVKGFARRNRSDAPAPIAATSQFRELCPAAAIVMSRSLV
jgi:N-acetylglutamate synthase-like GNAT family acetyltransferase